MWIPLTGLSPTISIDQKSASHNPRSTVGTVTEIHDYMRLLYARVGEPHCPKHGIKLETQTTGRIVDFLLANLHGKKLAALAPKIIDRRGEHLEVFNDIAANGFARVRVDGRVYDLEDAPALARTVKHTIEIVVDRFRPEPSQRQRLVESIDTAAKFGDGRLHIVELGATTATRQKRMCFPPAMPVRNAAMRRRSWSRSCFRLTIRAVPARHARDWARARSWTRRWWWSIRSCRCRAGRFAAGTGAIPICFQC